MASRLHRAPALARKTPPPRRGFPRARRLRAALAARSPLLLPALAVSVALLLLLPSDDAVASTAVVTQLAAGWAAREDPHAAHHITIGIKAYVCDAAGLALLLRAIRSVRMEHPTIRVLVGNDGPTRLADAPFFRDDPRVEEVVLPQGSGRAAGRNAIVQKAHTEYIMFMDDDHWFTQGTNLSMARSGLEAGEFDLVGFRVWNLQGTEELENAGFSISHSVAKVTKFEDREVTLCEWDETRGPGVAAMRMPMPVDIVHDAFLAKTTMLRDNPWRDALKQNEQLTFFLDARDSGVKVGYLPSVYVHHAARAESGCYKKAVERVGDLDALVPYSDAFQWDEKCGENFPRRVSKFLASAMHGQLDFRSAQG